MDRKLATLRYISTIRPIEGADRIELATVDGWEVVIAKDVGHMVGNLIVYCEIDSFLPISPEYEFLRKSSYKKMGELEGFRIRTSKFRGVVSQGLILPLSVLDGKMETSSMVEGADVSSILNIVKYEKPIPAELAGKVRGNFPTFIHKTDESRIENLNRHYNDWVNLGPIYYESEKLEGSSCSIYLNDGVFGVCSRNIDLLEDETNTFWKVARQYNIEEKLRTYQANTGQNIAIQGELIGEGVQGNIYKLKGHQLRIFNVYNIGKRRYFTLSEMQLFVEQILKMQTVPILSERIELPIDYRELITRADGKSLLNPNTKREGLVIRSVDMSVSFKSISRDYLASEK